VKTGCGNSEPRKRRKKRRAKNFPARPRLPPRRAAAAREAEKNRRKKFGEKKRPKMAEFPEKYI
jgi:hypothetical protein